jgi:polysaccharide biosynthesis transport protein
MIEEMEPIQEQKIDLRSYLQVITKRRWTIVTFFVVVVVSVAIHTFTATPIYQATSRIVIDKENPNLVSIQEVLAVDSTGQDYYQTQYQIIESRSVAREVIKRLSLDRNPEFVTKPGAGLIADMKSWFRISLAYWKEWAGNFFVTGNPAKDGAKTGVEEDTDSGLVTAFLSRVKVVPVRNSRIVDIHFEARDPVLAARVSNEIVKSFIDQKLETKLVAAKDAVRWLAERIDDERKKVEKDENALLMYKEQQQIITDFSSDSEKITAQKLSSLNQQVVDAQSNRVAAETRYQQAMAIENSPDLMDSIPEVMKNDLVQNIKKMEVDIYNRMSELSKKYGANHPQMIAIQTELEELKKQKAKEAKRILGSLRNEYKLAQAREESVKRAMEAQKTETLSMNKKAVQYGVLQRQAESSRSIYELLIKRFKETSLTEEMKTGNIRVVDRAEVPRAPIKPRKQLNLMLAVVVGMLGGVGLAFFIDYIDNSVKFPSEVKDDLKIPYLGPIPAFAGEITQENVSKELVLIHSPKSTVSESFRGIRTGILFSSADAPPQVILVSSAAPAEGKSICVANIAIALAMGGSRVVILDCDMRKPRQHKIFKCPRENGISSVLVGTTPLSDVIVHTPVENLDLIPCGPIPPSPSEIVGSKKLGQLIDTLRKDYQHILIDSPPITAVTDSVLLSHVSDSVLMVIHAGTTPKPVVQNAIEQLQNVGAHIMGGVLNGVQTGRDSYNYYQYYYYYYGEDEKQKKSGGRSKKPARGAYS